MARAQVFLGIDVGHAAVKLAAISRQEDGWHLEGVATAPVAVSRDASSGERDAQEMAAVRQALASLRIRPSQAAINVPTAAAPVRKVRLPHASSENMESMIEFEAERFLPLPVAEINIDYHLIQGLAQAHSETLIAACRKDAVASRAAAAQAAGVDEPIVDVGAIALFNAATATLEKERVTALVDVGATATCVVVARSGEIELARSAMLGSDELTTAFAEDLRVDAAEAAEAKRREGLTLVHGVTDQPDLTTWQEASEQRPGVARWLGRLCQEIRHTLESYRSQAAHGAVQEVILAGGGALAPGLAAALEAALGIPARLVEGWEQLGVLGESPEPPAVYATAVGLALRAAGGAAIEIDLVPRTARASRQVRKRTGFVAAAGLVIGLGLALGGWLFHSELKQREGKLARVEADVERLEGVTGGVDTAQSEWAALDSIEGLSVRARDPRRSALGLLRDASTALPPDTWVEEYTYERGRLLRLRGHAMRSPLVKEAVSALAQMEHLGDVVLDDVVRGAVAEKTVYTFTISCHLPPEEEDSDTKRSRR